MKKNYFLFLLCLVSLFTKAQYTITSSSNPVPGDVQEFNDLDSTGLNFGSSGTSQIWNYTTIVSFGNPAKTGTYVAMSSVPNNTLFPGATIGIDEGGGDFGVLSSDPTKHEYLGYANATVSNCWTYSDPLKPYSLPFTYGSSSPDTYLLIQATNTTVGTFTTYGDGTGTLQLPFATIPNVLKLRYVQFESDTTSTGSVITFTILMDQYHAAISKFPLLEVQTMYMTTTTGTNVSTVYYKFGRVQSSYLTGIKENTNTLHANIFPNPVTTGELFISNIPNGKMAVEIYNMLGQIIKTVVIDNQKEKINMSDLSRGIYYLKLNTNEGIQTKKIIIE